MNKEEIKVGRVACQAYRNWSQKNSTTKLLGYEILSRRFRHPEIELLRSVGVKGRRRIELAGSPKRSTRCKLVAKRTQWLRFFVLFDQFESRGRGLRPTSFMPERFEGAVSPGT